MLTDLSFLQPGRPWPPPREKERRGIMPITGHYLLMTAMINIESRPSGSSRVIGEYREVVSYHIALNYPKRISVKTADLLLGDPPKWDAGEQTGTLDKIAARSALIGGSLREPVLDTACVGRATVHTAD